jgi:hypothetical protein
MRNVHNWFLAFTLLVTGACADGPTAPVTSAPDVVYDVGVQGCVDGGICKLPEITTPGEPDDPHCDMWWKPDCGACATSTIGSPEDMQGVSGCPGGGTGPGSGGDPTAPGGGGGGTPPPPPPCPDGGCEEPQPDPCITGDPKLDDPDVYNGFSALWAASNYDPTVPQSQRSERAGWLVQDGLGYRLVEIVNAAFYPCGVDIHETPPAGAVGVVHTHPWKIGETVTTCASGAVLYTGTPSGDDQATLRQFGFTTGYILDANGIGRFSASGGETVLRENRCGY